jgi:hypothetical protein
MPLTLSRALLVSLLAAAGALLVLTLSVRAQSVAGPVDFLGVDTDTAGNSPTSVGQVEVCSELEVGEERQIDIVVRGVPSSADGGLSGFQLLLLFDERFIHVTDYAIDDQFLAANDGSNVLEDFSDPVPNDTGVMVLAGVDFGSSDNESGDGVIARLTVSGVDTGTSDLIIVTHELVPFSAQEKYEVTTLQNALLTVGVDCAPNASPPPPPDEPATPRVTQLPETDAPGDNGGESPGASPDTPETPGEGETPGPTGSGAPTATRTAGASGNGDDDDGGGSGTLIIVALVVIAALAALGGAGYYFYTRRNPSP